MAQECRNKRKQCIGCIGRCSSWNPRATTSLRNLPPSMFIALSRYMNGGSPRCAGFITRHGQDDLMGRAFIAVSFFLVSAFLVCPKAASPSLPNVVLLLSLRAYPSTTTPQIPHTACLGSRKIVWNCVIIGPGSPRSKSKMHIRQLPAIAPASCGGKNTMYEGVQVAQKLLFAKALWCENLV